ncbi:MAG TPA: hypothetical protein VF148_02110 [Acidimicrobiia bacterium]
MSEGARDTGGTKSTGETAKEEAGRLTEDIKHEAGRVAGEARQQGRELMGETKERLREEADRQTGRTASGLKSMSIELRSMADNSEQPKGGVATWVRRGADEIDSFANRLDRDGIDGVARDVSDFARRNPTAFLLTTFGAGLLVGRLMKNVDGDRVMQGDGGGNRNGERATPPYRQSSQEISPAGRESDVTGRTGS